MAMKTLELSLGLVAPVQYAPGWYWDANAGQMVYFDGPTQRFYTLQNGVFVPLAQNWHTAPKQVTVAPGDKLQVTLDFQYIGPAVTGVNAHYSINYNALIGGEAMSQNVAFNIPANLTSTPVDVTNSYTFTIPANAQSNWTDIYVVISGGTPTAIASQEYGYSNAIVLIALAPTITGFTIKDFAKV